MSRNSILSIHNKKFWTEFFYLYHSLKALWDVDDPLYKNRQVKYEGYDKMVDKLRELEPNANREDVLRKINIFRTNYRRECSRINMNRKEGTEYQPALWYFDLLNFLPTVERLRDRKRKIDDSEKSIMRKRCSTNVARKSSEKKQYIEYQPVSTHEIEYELDDEQNFDYVPNEYSHALVNDKNDSSWETQENHLTLNDYDGTEEENDEDDQSQQEYNQQEELQKFSIQRNIQTNNKKLKLSPHNVSQISDQICVKVNPLEINETEDQQVYHEYSADNESETLQAPQWRIKDSNAKNIFTLQHKKEARPKAIKLNVNASTKNVRSVNTMTLNNSPENYCSKLPESSDILAKSWAIQYAEISQDQKILARKAINDILFEGCMGQLAMGSNGRVTTINSSDYKNLRSTRVSSNEEVESSEIYER